MILGLVLWIVFGLVAIGLLWVATVYVSGVLTVLAAAGEKPAWAAFTAWGVGISLTLFALVLVLYNVINHIVILASGG